MHHSVQDYQDIESVLWVVLKQSLVIVKT